ncbi:MAG: DUF2752 domain-containing protein [Mucilaginibacter polytrichastri]|nr:DUF2752 domain-containing protein [Mucilaginibacter polytrichastri]
MKRILILFFEPLIFISALLYLALTDPVAGHFSFCIFSHLGILCPGCGLGRSVSQILHGQISSSLNAHLLGLPALMLLLHRIFISLRYAVKTLQLKTKSYGHQLSAQLDP